MKLIKKFILKQFWDIKKGGFHILAKKGFAVICLLRNLYETLYEILYRPSCQAIGNYISKLNLVFAIKYELACPKPEMQKICSKKTNGKKIIFFTYVFGDYVWYYKKILIRSLFQSGNIPALLKNQYSIEWRVYVQQKDMELVKESVKFYQDNLSPDQRELLQVNLIPFSSPKVFSLQKAFLDTMQIGIQLDAYCFLAFPDFFFGNHSVFNIVKLARGRRISIFSLHLRVEDEKFLKTIENVSNEISNRELVRLTLENTHKAVMDAKIDAKSNGSFHSGLAIQEMTKDLLAVTFRIPSIYLASFTWSDFDYFSTHPYYHLDHGWQTLLFKEERYEIIGYSDVFFMAEVTKKEERCLPILNNVYGNDSVMASSFPIIHPEINRNFFMVMRVG